MLRNVSLRSKFFVLRALRNWATVNPNRCLRECEMVESWYSTNEGVVVQVEIATLVSKAVIECNVLCSSLESKLRMRRGHGES